MSNYKEKDKEVTAVQYARCGKEDHPYAFLDGLHGGGLAMAEDLHKFSRFIHRYDQTAGSYKLIFNHNNSCDPKDPTHLFINALDWLVKDVDGKYQVYTDAEFKEKFEKIKGYL